MKKYYLAVDIGASSGRHILGSLANGKIQLEEIYRFENGMTNKDGKLVWDTNRLFAEIVNGMKECSKQNKIPVSMSIDTWAVDYVLLDENDNVLGDTYGYRDNRTFEMDKEVYKLIPESELYKRTGIQKQIFNTIYQLMSDKLQRPELLNRAKTFLMLPDYFQFLLTGNKVSEYTNGTSTQLVSPDTKQWDEVILDKIGLNKDIFLPLQMPGTKVGKLMKEVKKEVGYDCEVILCASHDTASAVMSMPVTEGEGLYISSGTWSLMGIESKTVMNDEVSRKDNFTNEGGYDYRYRYLKNIMGLWMIQSVRHELKDKYSFATLCDMAEACKAFPSRVDVNCEAFLAPESMITAVKQYCEKTKQPIPETVGEVATVIYQSLAECYEQTIRQIENRVKKHYKNIYIIGGGSNARYLNQLTANATGKMVYAGPSEATAIGNLLVQMMKDKQIKDLSEARKGVHQSFDIHLYNPKTNKKENAL